MEEKREERVWKSIKKNMGLWGTVSNKEATKGLRMKQSTCLDISFFVSPNPNYTLTSAGVGHRDVSSRVGRGRGGDGAGRWG